MTINLAFTQFIKQLAQPTSCSAQALESPNDDSLNLAGPQVGHQRFHSGPIHRAAREGVSVPFDLAIVCCSPPLQVGHLAGMRLVPAADPDVDG